MDRNVSHGGVVIDRAAFADLLTFSRLVTAPFLTWLVASRRLDTAAVVLGIAWCTDFFDGRFARSALRDTLLKDWDLRADAWLAFCLAAGLGLGGYFPWWHLGPVAVIVFVGSILFTNPSAVMLGTGYLFGVFLWVVTSRGNLWWLPAVYVVVGLIASWRRFFRVILPAFWHGLVALVPGERRRGSKLVVDDWAD